MKIIRLLIFSLVFISCTISDKENKLANHSQPKPIVLKPIALNAFSGIELNTSIKNQKIYQQELTLIDGSDYLLKSPKGKLSNILGNAIESIEISTFRDSIINVRLNFEQKNYRSIEDQTIESSTSGFPNIVSLYKEKYGIPELIKSRENGLANDDAHFSYKYTWDNNDVIIQYIETTKSERIRLSPSTLHHTNSILKEAQLTYNSKYLQNKIDSIFINHKYSQDSLRLMKENKRRKNALEKI